jgi:hypothetical protein
MHLLNSNKYSSLPAAGPCRSEDAASSCVVDFSAADAPCERFEISNALPLILAPLNPPTSLASFIFCCQTAPLTQSSHMLSTDGDAHMFAYLAYVRQFLRRRDAPAPPPHGVSPVNFATEWTCELGVTWPKIVNYATQCSKGHTLVPITPSVQSAPCRICGVNAFNSSALSTSVLSPSLHCKHCSYFVCQSCISTLTPHVQHPPTPPPPSTLHRGVRLDVLRQFKSCWADVYLRWTTEQVFPTSASQQTFSYSQFPLPARFVSKSSSRSPRALVAATVTNCQCQHRVCLVLQLVSSVTLGATHSPTLSTQFCCISINSQQVSCLCVKCLPLWRCCTRASSHRSSPLAEPSILEFIPFSGERDGVIVWIDFFCDSQHARLPSWPPPAVIKDSTWFMNNFAELIAAIGYVLMVMQPWDAPMTLKRSWCVLELGHCSRANCRCFSTIDSSSAH